MTIGIYDPSQTYNVSKGVTTSYTFPDVATQVGPTVINLDQLAVFNVYVQDTTGTAAPVNGMKVVLCNTSTCSGSNAIYTCYTNSTGYCQVKSSTTFEFDYNSSSDATTINVTITDPRGIMRN